MYVLICHYVDIMTVNSECLCIQRIHSAADQRAHEQNMAVQTQKMTKKNGEEREKERLSAERIKAQERTSFELIDRKKLAATIMTKEME